MTVATRNGRNGAHGHLAFGRAWALGDDDDVVLFTPLAQYPDPVDGAQPEAVAAALEDDDVVLATPDGQYPDPVFLDADSAVQALESPMTPIAAPPLEADHALAVSLAEVPAEAELATGVQLTTAELFRIVRVVAAGHSGVQAHAATVDGGAAGLRFGLLLFSQSTGELGRVLELMQARDPGAFAIAFGSDAPALLAQTRAATPAERLAPVGGLALVDATWRERFAAAAQLPAFQAAQNEQAIEGTARPAVANLLALGASSDRSLAMALDRAVVSGPGGAVAWVLRVAGPLRTATNRRVALAMLGHADLTSFQLAVGLAATGVLDAASYVALVAALRARGVPAPDPRALAAAMLAGATGAAAQRLRSLHETAELFDVAYES